MKNNKRNVLKDLIEDLINFFIALLIIIPIAALLTFLNWIFKI